MGKKPFILVAGILDTKGEEIKFIADKVVEAGGSPVIMELSVGAEVGWADIPMSELAGAGGSSKDYVLKLERAKAADIIAAGGIKKVSELLKERRMDGIIAYGGSLGTSIATRIMQTVPLGVPKIMLSTMASGDCRPYIGTRDICMWYPVAEMGLNAVTMKVLSVAAGGIVGAALAALKPSSTTAKPIIGCTMFGTTTPAVKAASKLLEDRGYDVMIFHAVGSGGKSMEELVGDKCIIAVLDLTTHEITDLICGGILSAGSNRLTAAGEMGIPQVIVPGGADMINFGARSNVVGKRSKVTGRLFEDEKLYGGRAIYEHNPAVTVIGILPQEAREIARNIVEKLNKAKGPTVLLIPMRGWSAYDIRESSPELGWLGPGPGPFWDGGDPNHPEWSKRAVAFVEAAMELVDKANLNLDVLICDKHINEPEFAVLSARILVDMLDGRWRRGMYRDAAWVQSPLLSSKNI